MSFGFQGAKATPVPSFSGVPRVPMMSGVALIGFRSSR